MRTSTLLAIVGCTVAFSVAHALTTPMTGATLFPTTGQPLRLPFPAGAQVRIVASYGPSNGSSLHSNITAPSNGNDYYALDLVYDGEADGGLGMPIVAAVGGEVVRAGWATAGWANFGQRIILRHDLGDGHVYHSLYAHLNAIAPDVVEGAMVTQGQILGELGGSCQGALSCSSFSLPHVHFSVHRDSTIGGSGTGGSYGGNAVVPEPLDGYEDLLRGQVLTSMNTGVAMCGDGFCSGDESNASCPGDCPICEPIPAAGRIVDESEPCFVRGGDPSYWREEAAGWADSLLWTHTTDAATVDDHGVWELTFAEAGTYRVEAYTDGGFAQAQQAAYAVTHGGATETVVIDQSAVDGWQSLGEWTFGAGGGQGVQLNDNTGESFDLRRQIVFDALRLTRTDPLENRDAGVPTEGGVLAADGGGGAASDGGRRMDLDADGGCSCASSGPSGASWGLALVVLGLVRRRRR